MMMNSDSKKAATVILMKKKPIPNAMGEISISKEKDGAEQDIDPGLIAAAEEIMASFDKKDAVSLAMAMKDFITICDSYGDDDSGDDSE
jgi:hypothetical protein